MFSPGNQRQLQESFAAFCKRDDPEIEALLDRAQAEELREKTISEAENSLARLIMLAEEAGSETMHGIRPFLTHGLFVDLMLSTINDKQEGETEAMALSRWLSNEQTTSLLRAAKKAMDNNEMECGQLEKSLYAHLTAQGAIKPAAMRSPLPASLLVEALNEVSTHRAKAENLINSGQLDDAAKKFQRCLSILTNVRGSNDSDDSLVITTRVEVLTDLGRLKIMLHEYGSAVSYLDQALQDDPKSGPARLSKARALALRHEHKDALEELDIVQKEAPYLEDDADDVRDLIRDQKIADKRRSKELAQRMFS